MTKGFVYLIAIVDWLSRRILSSHRKRALGATRLSIIMDTAFCARECLS
jgi:hypothetical protein